ncbi:MAG: hypothetical protein CVV41_01870 [Candidatus Riflebacteria bacterium HGW-Riflebacteria-1]|nr:MAG: hypothetical protein CVV41_01870 [Candidatus Riflebacteria bacterium HGW-Riflebacteria-1]
MSVIRLIMSENGNTASGHIPSASISAVMWAIAKGAKGTDELWTSVDAVDPGLKEHFLTNLDNSPLLEGYDDGLLVISWDHRCIESFQAYQPLRHIGQVIPHNGKFLEKDKDPLEYNISSTWSIIDHHFEESRH